MSIQAKKLNYTYQVGTPLEHVALQDVSINIEDGSYTAIVGHTGSGKSTLLQHLNGLLKPTSGEISINGYTIDNTTKNKELGKLRKEVGFVFQFPEAQLFEETVLKDIAFAPKNFGKSEDEAEKIAREKAKLVALPEEVLEKSPFELSGGQMRRVAIAGILAMEPKVLVLDEPTAGLDPEGRHQMMEMFNRLHKDENLTIILVTHQMNDVAEYADHVIVLESGKIIADSTPKELFSDPEWLKNHHLNLPQTTDFAYKLFDKLALSKSSIPLKSEELADEILKILGGNLNE
ncbi:energy-coupling factor ABC transporter ATP-binding protein [Ligilactobacillus salivarius]|uniref:energy-coupling factor ABC transporter ATP-binding protein n=1 Tax=Ligilactobacillus salivarius TaxID=1624 RepID=UPI0013691549|nr:energy-coupling factor ABC transporter ATP-binding protein [Ligilactobacillus salivarius]MYU58260.1 energy-coupling factor ABC transporter ATP-binding protein [Ligilactobacillus salivarius]MYU60370.1 energy-coupling factor ABC transporter ATP-binding protein [Ligilactobacillus salivarius]MYU83487.1 energy-coupling factor ABC transporter ATP-binding protein [Ligilactobacillus salivarius]MYU90994.1 energy-coupling factor ABC transporter ATP-binding protein [Ligilactobacillus salivarius]MYV032